MLHHSTSDCNMCIDEKEISGREGSVLETLKAGRKERLGMSLIMAPGHSEIRLNVRDSDGSSKQTIRDLDVGAQSVFRVWELPEADLMWEAFSS